MFLRLLLSLALAVSGHAALADPAVFWSGSSANYQVSWSASDLLAKDSSGKTVFSAKAAAEQGFHVYQAEMQPDDVGKCTYVRSFKMAGLVGTFLTFQDQLETSCDAEAHPGYLSRYTTIDLSKVGGYLPSEENDFSLGKKTPPGIVSLRDLFPDATLLKALNADSVLKKAIGTPASSLDELRSNIGDDGAEVTGKACHFRLADDYLTRFAIHHVEQDRVAVRLKMTPIGGACASQTADLGLLLPIPDELQSALAAAGKGKEGFLALNVPVHASAGNDLTVITFHAQRV